MVRLHVASEICYRHTAQHWTGGQPTASSYVGLVRPLLATLPYLAICGLIG